MLSVIELRCIPEAIQKRHCVWFLRRPYMVLPGQTHTFAGDGFLTVCRRCGTRTRSCRLRYTIHNHSSSVRHRRQALLPLVQGAGCQRSTPAECFKKNAFAGDSSRTSQQQAARPRRCSRAGRSRPGCMRGNLLQRGGHAAAKFFRTQAVVRRSSLLDAFRLRGACLLYTSPSPRDRTRSRMPSSA